MKLCPQCHQTFTDETLKFCRDDGTLLQINASFPAEASTLTLSVASTSDALPTELLQSETAQGKEITTSINTARGLRTRGASHVQRTSSAKYFLSGVTGHKLAVAIILSVMILAAVGFGYWFFINRSTNAKQIESIAVLPFANDSGNADVEYLSDGMTETLISSLSRLPRLNVKARSSVFRYKGRDVEAKEIGRQLGVQAVLTGRVVGRGNNLTLFITLVDTNTDNVLWSATYNRQMTNLVALQRDVARDVSERLQLKLSGADEQKLAKNYTENAEAYQFYLRGRYFWNKRSEEGMKKSIEYFRQAVEKDNDYALGYVGLADAYATLSWYSFLPPREAFPLSEEAAKNAVEADDRLAEAHTSLAHAKELYRWDWTGAEIEYRRAIALNPDYAVGRYWYAVYLVEHGRADEAIAEMKQALEAEPASPIINAGLGQVLYLAHKYDESIEQLRKTVELEPDYFFSHLLLGWAYSQSGRHSEAIEALKQASQLQDFPLISASLGFVYARSGQRTAAMKILSDLRAQSARRYVSPLYVALIYAGLEDKEQALAWLEKAFEDRSVMLPWLKVSPQFENLHSDPRFQGLLRRIGLPS